MALFKRRKSEAASADSQTENLEAEAGDADSSEASDAGVLEADISEVLVDDATAAEALVAVEDKDERYDQAAIDEQLDQLSELTWQEAEAILVEADLGSAMVAAIIQAARGEDGRDGGKSGKKRSGKNIDEGDIARKLHRALVEELEHGWIEEAPMPDEQSDDETDQAPNNDAADSAVDDTAPAGKVEIWLMVGVNGVGKTTSTAKLAKAQTGQGKSVVLAAADTFRAAAIEQLQTWADRLDVPLVKGASGGDPAAVVFDAAQHAAARGADLVIADTAGRMHTKDNLMAELQKIKRVAHKSDGTVSEILLVIDATTGQNGIAQAEVFQQAVEPTGIVLTKLDGSSKGGVVLSAQRQLAAPVKFIGTGEGADDLQPFVPEVFAADLLAG